ncbi:hypothetical protein [Bradyrhizobium yuanmingense]|uniref:hypothetical protein n=1 Tax=Bradyrhizobium yuanmingense TaxID=108015 RepID=UPI0023B8CAE5|nr:hypothetical protein [Bradyrhizobium yuanmingense]MDF0498261.1 hypothetical protein [Bradyrhizobium yuanmingense]
MMNYVKYLTSAAWRNNPVRLREFSAAGFQCRLCPNSTETGHVLEAHHRTYVRFGCEIDGDLTALCHECHKCVTSMLRARRYAALSSAELQDFSKFETLPLFDPSFNGSTT